MWLDDHQILMVRNSRTNGPEIPDHQILMVRDSRTTWSESYGPSNCDGPGFSDYWSITFRPRGPKVKDHQNLGVRDSRTIGPKVTDHQKFRQNQPKKNKTKGWTLYFSFFWRNFLWSVTLNFRTGLPEYQILMVLNTKNLMVRNFRTNGPTVRESRTTKF